MPIRYSHSPFTDISRGFTLAELLISLSIIAMILVASIFALVGSLKNSRDNKRVSDMESLKVALELFYQEHGRYPGVADGIPLSGYQVGVGQPIDAILEQYIHPVPRDPLHDGTTYYYAYDPEHQYNPPLPPFPATQGQFGLCSADPSSHAAYPGHAVVVGFRKSETNQTDLQKDTCSGAHQELDAADYNFALFPSST